MLKAILIFVSVLLGGIAIGIQISIATFRDTFKDYKALVYKYGKVLEWIGDIPFSSYNDEFVKHQDKLVNDILRSDGDDDA